MSTLVGQTVGKYSLEELLGTGGFNSTYRGRHVEIGKEVAVKVAQSHDGGRLLTEARTLARLRHPSIISILGSDFDSDIPHIVLELGSEGLRRYVGQASWNDAVGMIRDIASGVAYAHSQGIIHSDLKPENIVIVDGVPKIIDYNLAKRSVARRSALEGSSQDRELLNSWDLIRSDSSNPRMLAGTPAYWSPEQKVGDVITEATDVYQLGVVLYELLTGERPEGAWKPVSSRTNAPSSLDGVIEKMLQARPERRCTAEQVEKELESITGKKTAGTTSRQTTTRIATPVLESVNDIVTPSSIDYLVQPTVTTHTRARTPTTRRTVHRDHLPVRRRDTPTPSWLSQTAHWATSAPYGYPNGPSPLKFATQWAVAAVAVAAVIYGVVASRAADERSVQPRVSSLPIKSLSQSFVQERTPPRMQPSELLPEQPFTPRIAFTKDSDNNKGVYVIDTANNNQRRLTNNPPGQSIGDFSWSPDGTRIAFELFEGLCQIYVMKADGTEQKRLTTPGNSEPVWSPDGRRMAFTSNRDFSGDGSYPGAYREIYVMNADGSIKED